jgi:tol-pal system protein YbgF
MQGDEMMRKRMIAWTPRVLLVGVLGLVTIGCVSRAAVRRMADQLDYLEASQRRMERDLIRLDSMLVESVDASTLTRADVGTSLAEFRDDARQMRATIDDLRQQIERRPPQVVYQPMPMGTDSGATITDPNQPGMPPVDIDPSQLYENAFLDVRKGNYELAIAQFRDVLEYFGRTEYAPNARYWIGECWYSLEQYDSAIVEFDVLVSSYPSSDRLPTALYKMGRCYEEKGRPQRAREYYGRVINEYANSLEAKPAQSRLSKLE